MRMNDKTTNRPGKSPGFTLVEMLIGLSIFSVIALVLYSAFWNAIKIQQKTERMNRISRQTLWGIEQMARDLENMVPYRYEDSYPGKKGQGHRYPDERAFKGSADRISLIKATDEGLKVVNYSLRPPERGVIHRTVVGKKVSRPDTIIVRQEETFEADYLVREEKLFIDYLSDHASPQQGEEDVLSITVQRGGLRFYYAYLRGDENSQEIIWKENWEEQSFPLMVRIEVTFLAPGEDRGIRVLTREVWIPTGTWGKEDI